MANNILIFIQISVPLILLISTFFYFKKENIALSEKINSIEAEKGRVTNDKKRLEEEIEKYQQDQENLKNALLLFQKEQSQKKEINNKSDREIIIDLFLSFKALELSLDYMSTRISSIDSKLIGIKDYSISLNEMRTDISTNISTLNRTLNQQVESINNNIRNLYETYTSSLTEIHSDLKNSLSNIDTEIRDSISTITNQEMSEMMQKFDAGSDRLNNTIHNRLEFMTNTVNEKLKTLSTDFGDELSKHIITESTIQDIIDESLNLKLGYEQFIGDNIENNLSDIEDSINDVYNVLNNDDSISSIMYSLEKIESDINNIESNISNLTYN